MRQLPRQALPARHRAGDREVFRLAVVTGGGALTFHGPVLHSRKEATAQVAGAIRAAASHTQVLGIVLQKATMPANAFLMAPLKLTPAVPQVAWTPVEHWGPEVVRRVLEQNRQWQHPELSVGHGPCGMQHGHALLGPTASRARSRWHVGLAAALAVVSWMVATLILAAFRPGEALADPPAVTVLPFDAPQSAPHPAVSPALELGRGRISVPSTSPAD